LVLLGIGILLVSQIFPAIHYLYKRPMFVSLYSLQFALYGLACRYIWRRTSSPASETAPARRDLRTILLFAVIFRLVLALSGPWLSDDLYRYVWDGKVQAAGINPYRYVPQDDHLSQLRDEKVYPNINRRDYARTIYPPGAQALFLGSYTLFGSSLRGMKLLFAGFDVLTILVLVSILRSMRVDPRRVILYAWHPLPFWEFAHSGHVDSAALAFLVLAWWLHRKQRMTLAGVLLGLATLVKLYPILLLPAFHGKRGWRLHLAAFATVVLGYLPYLGVGRGVLGFLPDYLEEESYANGDRFHPLALSRFVAYVPTWAYLCLAGAVFGALAWKVAKRIPEPDRVASGGLLLTGAMLALGTPHYPWYYVALLPFLCACWSPPWFYLASAAALLYPHRAPLVWATLLFVPTYVFLVAGRLRRR
jgi:hypothetical protein